MEMNAEISALVDYVRTVFQIYLLLAVSSLNFIGQDTNRTIIVSCRLTFKIRAS